MAKKPDKLAQDVAKAKAANMSYGRWKAMQDPVKIKRTIPDGCKKCIGCGEIFRPHDSRQMYCDIICRNRVNAKKQRSKRIDCDGKKKVC